MPSIEFIARALLGWAPWVLLPLFTLQATGGTADAALAAAAGVAMLVLFYRLSPEASAPELGAAKAGKLTLPLSEAQPLRPARDIAPVFLAAGAVDAPASGMEPHRVLVEIASGPMFIAIGYLQHGTTGNDWAGALLYTGLASAALFAIAAPVAFLVSRSKADRTPAEGGWAPYIPLGTGAVIFLAVVYPAGLMFLGAVAFALLIISIIGKEYKDAWNGKGRHRR